MKEKVESKTESTKYEKPEVKVVAQTEVLKAVNKGSKFPARGFAG